MDDYISRKAVLKCIAEDGYNCEYDLGYWSHNTEFQELIKEIPAADVRPVVKAIWKHVQWVVDEEWQEGGYWISRCSNCSMPYHTETPFCPHCGADMRDKKE